jgi:hypothetical protein
MKFLRFKIVLILLTLKYTVAVCQPTTTNQIGTVIINGDTIQSYQAKPILILPAPIFANNDDLKKFRKLVTNIKVVYPYSKLGKTIFQDIQRTIDTMPNKHDRTVYIKTREKVLMSKYQDELKALSVTQGQLLMKLMDREVNKTTYEIIKETRGTMQAFMWQQLARLFGSDLKIGYDSTGEDKMIERIILLIDNGQL